MTARTIVRHIDLTYPLSKTAQVTNGYKMKVSTIKYFMSSDLLQTTLKFLYAKGGAFYYEGLYGNKKLFAKLSYEFSEHTNLHNKESLVSY